MTDEELQAENERRHAERKARQQMKAMAAKGNVQGAVAVAEVAYWNSRVRVGERVLKYQGNHLDADRRGRALQVTTTTPAYLDDGGEAVVGVSTGGVCLVAWLRPCSTLATTVKVFVEAHDVTRIEVHNDASLVATFGAPRFSADLILLLGSGDRLIPNSGWEFILTLNEKGDDALAWVERSFALGELVDFFNALRNETALLDAPRALLHLWNHSTNRLQDTAVAEILATGRTDALLKSS